MALAKKPKAGRLRAQAKADKHHSKRKRPGANVVKAESVLDLLVPGGSSKKGSAEVAPKTNSRSTSAAPHERTKIRLGVRRPRDDEPIRVLQIQEDFYGSCEAERFVATMLIEEFRQLQRTRDEGAEWYAWIGSVSYHPTGLIFWVGVSSSAPANILDTLDDVIRVMGFATARCNSTAGKSGLSPLLYLGDEGLEVLRMF